MEQGGKDPGGKEPCGKESGGKESGSMDVALMEIDVSARVRSWAGDSFSGALLIQQSNHKKL
jgi:hypothetical protein